MPRLSVHMAARNSEATIERAIRSTLAALPKDAELVVGDDASSDGTADRVLAIVDPRLRLLRRSRSEGIGPARQHLLDTTDSEFVATMDSDDVCLPWRFRTQLPRLERSVDLCFTSVVSFREAAGRVSRVRPGLPLRIDARALPLHLLVMNMLHNAAMAARRATLVEAGGYRHVLGEDHDLWLRVIAAGGERNDWVCRGRRTATTPANTRVRRDSRGLLSRKRGCETRIARSFAPGSTSSPRGSTPCGRLNRERRAWVWNWPRCSSFYGRKARSSTPCSAPCSAGR